MLLLDTDHLGVLQHEVSSAGAALAARLDASGDEIAATIVSVEEQARGWLAAIHREKKVHSQIPSYLRFQRLFEFFAALDVLPWDVTAAETFEQLRASRIRIGTMDLKIASIALTNDALLLTRNTVDFEKVPGLKFADWLA